MHCPTCRHDNPPTTRFCSACGAVLVESAPDGRRRRVLRPWGLRRSAPPTISPDMPDLGVPQTTAPTNPLDVLARLDLGIVAGLVAVVVAATWLNGNVRSGSDSSPEMTSQAAAGAGSYVYLTTPPIVHEAHLKAPPLVDAAPPPRQAGASAARAPAMNPPPTARTSSRAAPVAPVVASLAREPAAIEPPRVANPPPAPVSVATATTIHAPDRWEQLRVSLAQCGSVGGTIAQAMCEQEARLARCDGFWGLVPSCPLQRTEYGQ